MAFTTEGTNYGLYTQHGFYYRELWSLSLLINLKAIEVLTCYYSSPFAFNLPVMNMILYYYLSILHLFMVHSPAFYGLSVTSKLPVVQLFFLNSWARTIDNSDLLSRCQCMFTLNSKQPS